MNRLTKESSSTLTVTHAREFKAGEYGKRITYFPSRKNHAYIACESLLEADFCLYLEYLPSVQRYCSHPLRFILSGPRNRRLIYTPDFFVTLKSGTSVFYEIKPDILLEEGRTKEKITRFQNALANEGYLLEPVAESRFHAPALIHNLHYLYSNSFGSSPSGIEHVVLLIESAPTRQLSARQLLEAPDPPSAADIADALFSRKIRTDLRRFFSINSVLSPVRGR